MDNDGRAKLVRPLVEGEELRGGKRLARYVRPQNDRVHFELADGQLGKVERYTGSDEELTGEFLPDPRIGIVSHLGQVTAHRCIGHVNIWNGEPEELRFYPCFGRHLCRFFRCDEYA